MANRTSNNRPLPARAKPPLLEGKTERPAVMQLCFTRTLHFLECAQHPIDRRVKAVIRLYCNFILAAELGKVNVQRCLEPKS
jgi:hypothetical protein